MADLTNDDVLKLAKLSKLELTDEQLEKFRVEMESIVEYVEQLQAVDVSGLKPTDQVTGLTNVMRSDEVSNMLCRQSCSKIYLSKRVIL